jgi:Arc/MetJ-type ribon-helix-helix transcriptional regulator
MRTTKSITISLPPKQLKTAERLAKKQNRTMSELFREGLRRLEQEEQEWRPSPAALRDLGNVIRLIQQDAKRASLDKLTKREINAEVEAARKETHANTRRSINRSGR